MFFCKLNILLTFLISLCSIGPSITLLHSAWGRAAVASFGLEEGTIGRGALSPDDHLELTTSGSWTSIVDPPWSAQDATLLLALTSAPVPEPLVLSPERMLNGSGVLLELAQRSILGRTARQPNSLPTGGDVFGDIAAQSELSYQGGPFFPSNASLKMSFDERLSLSFPLEPVLFHPIEITLKLLDRKVEQSRESLVQADPFTSLHGNARIWLWFGVSNIVLLCLSACVCCASNRWKFPLAAEENPNLVAARGRPCWSYCCIVFSLISLSFVFWLVVSLVEAKNIEIEEQPLTSRTMSGQTVVVQSFEMTDVGYRGFEAFLGTLLSMAIATIILTWWRTDGPVRFAGSLMAQFVLRGATLSLFVAALLEFTGQLLLLCFGFSNASTDTTSVGTALMMMVVGVSEEFAKLIAVTCGASWTASSLIEGRMRCCFCCATLIESSRQLALAGLAAGFGFMIVENAGYVIECATIPPSEVKNADDGQETLTKGAILILTSMTIFVRVMFNIHPWLTGLSARRAARIVFEEGNPDNSSIGCFGYVRALWPAAFLHGLYDFLLIISPGFLGLLWPPIFSLVSYKLFALSWPKREVSELEAASYKLEVEAALHDAGT